MASYWTLYSPELKLYVEDCIFDEPENPTKLLSSNRLDAKRFFSKDEALAFKEKNRISIAYPVENLDPLDAKFE